MKRSDSSGDAEPSVLHDALIIKAVFHYFCMTDKRCNYVTITCSENNVFLNIITSLDLRFNEDGGLSWLCSRSSWRWGHAEVVIFSFTRAATGSATKPSIVSGLAGRVCGRDPPQPIKPANSSGFYYTYAKFSVFFFVSDWFLYETRKRRNDNEVKQLH